MRIFRVVKRPQIYKKIKKMTRSPFYKWCEENYGIIIKGCDRKTQWGYYEKWFEEHYGAPFNKNIVKVNT